MSLLSSSILANCIHGAETGFGISALVEGGVILASGETPPTAVAVGGLIAGAFIGCIAYNYFKNPLQPIITNDVADLINLDEGEFSDVLRQFTDLYDQLVNTTNNFNINLTPGLKYDLLWILALNYNNYYNYIGSVQSYKEYILKKIIDGLNPFIQNIIFSAQAYAQTFSQINNVSGQTSIGNFSVSINNVQPVIVYPLGNFGDKNYIPFPVGFGVQYQTLNNINTLVVLMDNPSKTYVIYNPNTGNYSTITFSNVIVENVPLGLIDILPFVLAEQYANQNQGIVLEMNSINANINGSNVVIDESIEPISVNYVGNNIAVLIDLNSVTNPSMYISSNTGYTGSYISFEGVVKYLEFLNNINLTIYAQDLWDYYHNLGYTQAQLYNILKGSVFNIYFPQCQPSAVYQESQYLFTILNDLYQQGNTANLSIFPIFAGGIFTLNGKTLQGYIQFNKSEVLKPGQCTSSGGIFIDTNSNVYYIPPGTPICNSGKNTVVFRPDIYEVQGVKGCNFVPIPFSLLQLNNTPENTDGVIFDLDMSTTFTANQQYSQNGWYVNSALQSYNCSPTGISFTPTSTFTYIPYNQGYLILNNSGLQTTEKSVKNQLPTNTLLWILAILLLGGVFGAVLYKKTHNTT